MVVESETEEVHEARRTALNYVQRPRGTASGPCHRLCPLRMNIPVMIRQVMAGGLEDAIVTVREALPMPAVLGRLCHHPCEQGCRRGAWDNPAGIRNLERFVADWDLGGEQSAVHSPQSTVQMGKSKLQTPKSKAAKG